MAQRLVTEKPLAANSARLDRGIDRLHNLHMRVRNIPSMASNINIAATTMRFDGDNCGRMNKHVCSFGGGALSLGEGQESFGYLNHFSSLFASADRIAI